VSATRRADEVRTDVTGAPSPRGSHVGVVLDGRYATYALPSQGSLTVGRGEGCDVVIDHPSVSRRHAAIHVGAPLAVEDLGSSNGTRVAGAPLAPNRATPLAPGAIVEIGAALLMVHLHEAAAGAPSLADPAEGEAFWAPDSPLAALEPLFDLVAASPISVLILGETGVGKDRVAERIHQRSPRARRPLLRLNCAALPEALLESELFGHERGAFTGAVQAKAGLLETADGGSVFLDEIGELPAATQAKLLRVLENRVVTRVGGLHERPLDVRFMAATHRDLHELVAAGSFRRDLYFRLEGISITLPPLRERPMDLELYAAVFARRARRRLGKPDVQVSAAALVKLLSHSWPGNVRELKNVIERGALLCQGTTILPEHLLFQPIPPTLSAPARTDDQVTLPPPPALPAPATIPSPARARLADELDAVERARIEEALAASAGNQTRAAELLGVSRRTLVRRLGEFQMLRPRKR
jgi:transcriptional regulator with PAS, ATPase and Fis domain